MILVVFIFATWCSCYGSLPVVISTGAFIKPILGVTVYNDVELIHHIFSDLPNPPRSIATTCPKGATQKSCNLSSHLFQLLEDNSSILTLLNKARTTFGLSIGELPLVSVPSVAFRPVTEPQVMSDLPDDEIIKNAGRSWFADVVSRLEERQPFLNGTDGMHNRNKRWIQYLKPIIVGAAALMGADDLVEFISNLFVNAGGIAKFLATLQASAPEKSFVDLSRRVSKFEESTRNIMADMATESNAVKKITDDLQNDVFRHKMDLATVQDSNIVSQQMLSDAFQIMFTYGIYFASMHADSICRSGYISPLVLPPQLLAEKLASLASQLPPDLKLAITLDQIQKYYTIRCASCLYDSNGGIVTISVPVVFKSTDYQLYEYRNMYFAWEDQTCTLESASRFVVKDVKANRAYPVEDADEEKCSPYTSKRCKVPPESDSAEAFCLTTLLSSSTVSEVREACRLICFKRKETIVSQLAPNVFLGVHVPKNELTVVCPNHDAYNVTESVTYRSLRIVTNCACRVVLNKKTIGRSSGPACKGHESVTIDILLPGHWTTLTDYLPFTESGDKDGTKFIDQSEIFNKHALDLEVEDADFFTAEVSVLSVVWNFIHSLILAYMMFRLNIMNGTGAVVGLNAVRMVEARQEHYCRLENDVYYLLYIICSLCSLAFIPPIIWKFYKFLSSQFWDAVDIMADKKITDSI